MRLRLAILALLTTIPRAPAELPRILEWQPLQDYITIIDPTDRDRAGMSRDQRINPFVSYTNIGTDYGFLGQSCLSWKPGAICVDCPTETLAGIWHSLTKRAVELEHMLDFQRCYPRYFAENFQPRVQAFKIRAEGHGTLLFDLKTNTQETVWSHSETFTSDTPKETTLPLTFTGKAKFFNWRATGACNLCVDSIQCQVSMPPLPTDLRIFLKSYAKLAYCYSEKNHTVADRMHVESGAFDAVPATGLFCLTTAAAAREGIVTPEFAQRTLHNVIARISQLPAPHGVLPHFIRLHEGAYTLHPQTEYSTVDTAIYYHAMLIAAHMLGDSTSLATLQAQLSRLEFPKLRNSEGRVIHGLDENKAPLVSHWYDWGGETALVLLLQKMADPTATPQMSPDGQPWRGCGFIAELQSLFYPQFDQTTPDALTHQNWPAIRRALLQRQLAYFHPPHPDQKIALPIYGLSAGEAFRGLGYTASGVDQPGLSLVFPHYMLMSASHSTEPVDVYGRLILMEQNGLFPPLGLVENVDLRTGEYLPMVGSLNAAFEAISAYHLMKRTRGEPDLIYQAAITCPPLAAAIKIFYP